MLKKSFFVAHALGGVNRDPPVIVLLRSSAKGRAKPPNHLHTR
jgi:hypothetical protein